MNTLRVRRAPDLKAGVQAHSLAIAWFKYRVKESGEAQ